MPDQQPLDGGTRPPGQGPRGDAASWDCEVDKAQREAAAKKLRENLLLTWPNSSQRLLLGLVVLSLVLLAWYGLGMTRLGSTPTLWEEGIPLVERLDLNKATEAELMQVPGLGPKLAARIVAYRQEKGLFADIKDLDKVAGVGPITLARLGPWFQVDPSAAFSAHTLMGQPPPLPADWDKKDQSGSKAQKSASPETDRKEKININTANSEELQRLPRIGVKMAQRIIEERQKRPFATVEELRRVYGIGVKTMNTLRPLVTVEEEEVDD